MFLKNIWLKLTNNHEYQKTRITKLRNNQISIFKKQFEKEINSIKKKINNQNELNFLHSGHAADIINSLPVIKKLSVNHKCNLYININKPIKSYYKHPAGKHYLNDRIYNMLVPLLNSQSYINKVENFSKT